MADIFDVIADETRRDLLGVLLDRYVSPASETGEISVGDLVDHLGLSQPTVSKHLKVLRDHGLVAVREEGQHRYYRLEATPLEIVEDWLVPFLAADVDEPDAAARAAGNSPSPAGADTAVYAAWSGVDVGETIGRRLADGTFQARAVIHDASTKVVERLPKSLRRRP